MPTEQNRANARTSQPARPRRPRSSSESEVWISSGDFLNVIYGPEPVSGSMAIAIVSPARGTVETWSGPGESLARALRAFGLVARTPLSECTLPNGRNVDVHFNHFGALRLPLPWRRIT